MGLDPGAPGTHMFDSAPSRNKGRDNKSFHTYLGSKCAISDVITHKNHTQKTCLVLDILAEGEGFEPPHAPVARGDPGLDNLVLVARGDPGLDTSSPKAQRFSSSSEFVLYCPSGVILYHLVLFASRLQSQ
jgi:hypothetical protein